MKLHLKIILLFCLSLSSLRGQGKSPQNWVLVSGNEKASLHPFISVFPWIYPHIMSTTGPNFLERGTGGPAYGSATPITPSNSKITIVRLFLKSSSHFTSPYNYSIFTMSLDSRTRNPPLCYISASQWGPYHGKRTPIFPYEKVRFFSCLLWPNGV